MVVVSLVVVGIKVRGESGGGDGECCSLYPTKELLQLLTPASYHIKKGSE